MSPLRPASVLILGLIIIVSPASTRAQDSHYWTNQYGSRANLLGGTVVGGVKDLSATFYNPGALALGEEPTLALSTDAVQFSRIKIYNAGGQGVSLTSTQSGTAPKIFTIGFSSLHIVDGDRLAIAIVTRHDFKLKTENDLIDQRDVLPGPGLDSFAGEILLDADLYESWWGFSWAKQLEERNLSIGVSTFLAYRSQGARYQAIAQAVSPDSVGSAILLWDDYQFNNMRAIWKLGALYGTGTASVGIAVTTPGLDFWGSGSTKVNASAIDVTSGGGGSYSLLAANTQRDIPSEYRSPLSVAIGAQVALGKTSLWGTAEWFDAVKPYDVLDAEPFRAQTSGQIISAKVQGAARSVRNAGIGIEHDFERSSIYGAFTTDFSYSTPDDGLSITSWDIYHSTFGGALTLGGIDVTGGLTFSIGRTESRRLIDLSSQDEGVLPDDEDKLTVSYRRIKAIFGFSVEF